VATGKLGRRKNEQPIQLPFGEAHLEMLANATRLKAQDAERLSTPDDLVWHHDGELQRRSR
jgi:hypothetical protein